MSNAKQQSGAGKFSFYREMLRGSAWTVLARWSVRLIGFVSLVILARLLEPSDFGIVAASVLVVSLLEIFASLGVQNHLIRIPEATREHCDTAWTISLLYATLTGALLCVLAPVAAWFFNDPRIELVVYVFAATSVLFGFENIGMALIRRDLNFSLDFRIVVYTRLIKFVVTVAFAFALRSYWAIVIGRCVGIVTAVSLSYLMHDYRPRLCLKKAREFLDFATFIVPYNFGRFLGDKVGVLTVGRMMSTATLGVFNLAAELANMLIQEIIGPFERALYPIYAKITDDPERLAQSYLFVLGAVATVCIPMGAGLASVATDMIPVVFGDKWLVAIPVLQWVGIYTVVRALTRHLTGNIMIVSGHEKTSAKAMWIELAIVVPLVIISAQYWGLMGIVRAMALSALLMVPVGVFFLTSALPINAVQLLGVLWRPVLASIAMSFAVYLVHLHGPAIDVIRLLLEVLSGALVYVLSLGILWRLAGCPSGVERKLWDNVIERIGQTKKPSTAT